jgi:hypothetical protein
MQRRESSSSLVGGGWESFTATFQIEPHTEQEDNANSHIVQTPETRGRPAKEACVYLICRHLLGASPCVLSLSLSLSLSRVMESWLGMCGTLSSRIKEHLWIAGRSMPFSCPCELNRMSEQQLRAPYGLDKRQAAAASTPPPYATGTGPGQRRASDGRSRAAQGGWSCAYWATAQRLTYVHGEFVGRPVRALRPAAALGRIQPPVHHEQRMIQLFIDRYINAPITSTDK